MVTKSDSVIRIVGTEDRLENKITRQARKHCWKFIADNLPDFAFAESNKYLGDATSIQVVEKRVLIQAVYSLIITILIALITIGYQVIKSARTDPSETLRYE